MVSNNFKQGDIIHMNFSPQAGHEQNGKRPALVVSCNTLNEHSTMVMVCPITNTDKNHPFHIRLNSSTKTTGVILVEQVRMLDIKSREASYIECAPTNLVEDVIEMIKDFIELSQPADTIIS